MCLIILQSKALDVVSRYQHPHDVAVGMAFAFTVSLAGIATIALAVLLELAALAVFCVAVLLSVYVQNQTTAWLLLCTVVWLIWVHEGTAVHAALCPILYHTSVSELIVRKAVYGVGIKH